MKRKQPFSSVKWWIVVLIILLAFPAKVNAQAEKFYLYCEIGGGIGTHSEVKIGLNSIVHEKHLVSVFFNYYERTAQNLPVDFEPGFTLFGDGMPVTGLTMFSLQYGRVLDSNLGVVRFSIKGGITAGSAVYPDNFRPHKPSGWLFKDTNYDYDLKRAFAGGLLLQPTIEFALSRRFGLSTGIYANINSFSCAFGIDAGMLIGGKMREKIRKQPMGQTNE